MKSLLRKQRLGQAAVADSLGVTTRTVRRWLSSETVDTGVLEKLCTVVGIELFDLCDLAARTTANKPEQLTLAQELTLVSDPVLWYLFHQILRGWAPDEIQKEMGLSEDRFVNALIALDRARLIDLFPFNQVRLRTARNLQYIAGGPYIRHVNEWLQSIFGHVDIGDPASVWVIDALKLSSASITHLRRRFEELKIEAYELSDADRRARDPSRQWYTVMLSAVCSEEFDWQISLGQPQTR